jgi:hypothetical protein
MRPTRALGLRVAVVSSLVAVSALVAAIPAGAEPGFALVQAMPGTIGAVHESDYSDISCATSTVCAAVGPFESGGRPTVATETSGVWGTSEELIPPSGAITSGPRNAELTSISCSAAGTCEAVGFYPLSSGAVLPMLFTESAA